MEDILKRATALAEEARNLDKEERRTVLDHFRSLAIGLEEPHGSAQRILYTYFELMAVRIGIDLGIFEALCESKTPVKLDELATRTKADRKLLGRVMRYLSSQGICKETGIDEFAASNVSRTWTIPGYQGAVRFYTELSLPGISYMPKFLKDLEYNNPEDATRTAVLLSQGLQGTPFFQWITTRPENLKDFAQFMQVQRFEMPTWMSVYPYTEKTENLAPERPLFVDVGGGFGHQSIALRMALPDLPNKVIVEDLPNLINTIPKHEGVEFIAQDFFQPQQIKGAKIYYLRNILHDWPDAQVVDILKHLKDALAEDSVILIDEMYLPEKGVHWQAANLDMQMMLYLASIERTEPQWVELIGRAGLKIQRTYQYTKTLSDTVIECVLA